MSNQNEIKCEDNGDETCEECGRTEKDCVDAGLEFDTGCLSSYLGQTLCPDCIPCDDSEDEDEDEDDVCYRLNRGLDCSVCYEKIIGKREYTGGQYADNDEPLCKVCWELPQHNCFHSCYKNANGKWWCENDQEDDLDAPQPLCPCGETAHPKDKDSDCWECDGSCGSCRNPYHWNLCDNCFQEDDSE